MGCASRLAVAALALAAMSAPAHAIEGMWMPEQVPALDERLRAIGFDGDPAAFASLTSHPMAAVVSLGGCSASFVSPEGLVVTNHHCVSGMLQYNSTPERNLLRDGFHARERDDELWAGPGTRVWVTVSFRDITDDIVGGLPADISDLELHELVERRSKDRVAACERDGLRCRVASFFDGLRWLEIAQRELHDVRLVYVPADGIGDFGGETDNFRWPRHAGDFAFLRAYVGPDGKPAAHSPDNVPYRPSHWLRVSARGASPGQVVVVAGYPGNTDRYATVAETRAEIEKDLPRRIGVLERKVATLEALGAEDPKLAIAGGAALDGLRNGLTYRRGLADGLADGRVMVRKEAEEAELRAWIAADPDRRARYGEALPALDRLQAEIEATSERDSAFRELFASSTALRSAYTAYRLALERPKSDAERDPDYQERQWSRIRERFERSQKSLDPRIDRALLRGAMIDAAALPAEQRIAALDRVAGLRAGLPADRLPAIVDAFLDRLYGRTQIFELTPRLSYLERSAEQLAASDDTFVRLAVDLTPFDQELERRDDTRQGARLRLRPRYIRAVLDKAGGAASPDANSTLRVTFGVVEGARGPDGVLYTPQTALAGMVRKNTGTGEFDAPKEILDAAARVRAGQPTPYRDAALGDVPVNFLSSVDTTGGNSGSPTLDGRGELVGLLFDGIWESITSDYVFDPATTRSIHVDSRYVLWNLAEVGRAERVLRELGFGDPPGPGAQSAR